jgi:hypothetical protein
MGAADKHHVQHGSSDLLKVSPILVLKNFQRIVVHVLLFVTAPLKPV